MSHYEINVSHGGHHLFATHERSIHTLASLRKIADIFSRKFPVAEGYRMSITRWESHGKHVDVTDAVGHAVEGYEAGKADY